MAIFLQGLFQLIYTIKRGVPLMIENYARHAVFLSFSENFYNKKISISQ